MLTSFDAKLVQRLEEYRERFYEVRDAFHLSDAVGFASLPGAHGAYTAGALPGVRKTDQGTIAYMAVCGFETGEAILSRRQSGRLIVPPNWGQKDTRVVSIYQRTGPWDGAIFEPRILHVPNAVLDGIVAHELAHIIEAADRIPVEIRRTLRRKRHNLVAAIKREEREELRGRDIQSEWAYMNGEDDIDVIASLFGFTTGVIAKLEYMIDCVGSYKGPAEDGLFVTPTRVARQLAYRRTQVQRYARAEITA
ncbi:M48 family metallopeptidase [Candidatus Woesearchaeota archaeon]|nr:M48 family metallopeptidase [Candidatus Woesearchaeota archaeon]